MVLRSVAHPEAAARASRGGTVAPPARVAAFFHAARAAGLDPTPLGVREVEATTVAGRRWRLVRLTWWRPFALRLGPWTLRWRLPRRGTFLEFAPTEVGLPALAQVACVETQGLPEVEEQVVFVERASPDPVLAVRVAGRWFELRRWSVPNQVWPEAPVAPLRP